MAKKKEPRPAPESESAPAKDKTPPLNVKKQEPLPPEAAKRKKDFLKDSTEIEGNILRSIYS